MLFGVRWLGKAGGSLGAYFISHDFPSVTPAGCLDIGMSRYVQGRCAGVARHSDVESGRLVTRGRGMEDACFISHDSPPQSLRRGVSTLECRGTSRAAARGDAKNWPSTSGLSRWTYLAIPIEAWRSSPRQQAFLLSRFFAALMCRTSGWFQAINAICRIGGWQAPPTS